MYTVETIAMPAMTSLDFGENGDPITLEHLLSIWPIVSSVASHTPAGDLISLSRASSTTRALTHGFPIDHNPHEQRHENSRGFLDLRIGNHQTAHWVNLKSLAPFSCSSPFHKEPKTTGGSNNVTRPCKYCSRPVCKACIVRSFFADPSQSKNTFRFRTRYLCQKCWDGGNLRQDFRYPAESLSREHVWRGRSYGQRGGTCSCSASEDNWMCRGCRSLQNIGGPTNASLADADKHSKEMIVRNREVGDSHTTPVQCYGLGCSSLIDEANRDRRRICLWCSKSLPRQFGGEDRLRWEEKQLEIRAAAAAARSADIEEWARNRFKTLTMSRREMRGTEECILLTGRDGPEHDEPVFVRHLDAVNYRKYMGERIAPSPASVYQSKHGRWVYSRDFLEALHRDRFASRSRFTPPAGIDRETLFEMTKKNGLVAARTNHEIKRLPGRGDQANIFRLAAQFYEAGLMNEEDIDSYRELFWNKSEDVRKLYDKLYEELILWEEMDEEFRKTWQPETFADLLAQSNAKRKEERQEEAEAEDNGSGSGSSRDHIWQAGSSKNIAGREPSAEVTSPAIPSYEAVINADANGGRPPDDSLEG